MGQPHHPWLGLTGESLGSTPSTSLGHGHPKDHCSGDNFGCLTENRLRRAASLPPSAPDITAGTWGASPGAGF